MLEDGLSYPMQGDSWIGRMLIGGLMILLSVFIVPILAFNGYLLAVLRSTIQGQAEPPAWADWGNLIVDGVKVTIVGLVYGFVPMLVFGGIGFLLFGLGGMAGDSGGGILGVFGLLVILLAIPVLFIVYYLVPAALSNMAVEGSLGAAFDFNMISNVVLTTDYFVAVLMPIVVGVIINIVSQVLIFTIIGALLVPFVSFYGQVAVFRMFGLAFAKQSQQGQASTSTASF